MTRKQIDISREIRLWIASVVGIAVAFPELRATAVNRVIKTKQRIEAKLKERV